MGEQLRSEHLQPASTAAGLVGAWRPPRGTGLERRGATIAFYQGLLEFPLIELFENRDYKGSTHFFFDLGIGNALAFFDFPGLDPGPYAEVLGGLHHLAISVEPDRWAHLRTKLDEAGVEYLHESGIVALLPRTGRRAHRADLRSARGDVRHQDRLIAEPDVRARR